MKSFTIALVSLALACSVAHAQPQYTIVDIGLIPGDNFSQGFGISPNGSVVTGRSVLTTTNSHAFTWTQGGGRVKLPNLTSPNRPFGAGVAVNNSGVVVGMGALDAGGLNPRPLIWQSGVVSELTMPMGSTSGQVSAINGLGVAVGSITNATSQLAVRWTGGVPTYISQQTPEGYFLIGALGINDSGRIVGQGADPNNAARNIGYVYNTATNTAFSVGALPGMNGAINFGVSNAGHVVGGSDSDGGADLPFIWTDAGGIHAIPLLTGTSMGAGYGVNSAGWVVGTMGGASAVPFLYDGTTTYALADLIPAGSGWNFLTSFSASAVGISENNIIVGAAEHNGEVHAYAMIPVPEPSSLALVGFVLVLAKRRKTRECRSAPGIVHHSPSEYKS